MERFVVGDIVVFKFPFSDLSSHKLRPSLVVAIAEYGDIIVCQITSKSYSSERAIKFDHSDFVSGSLPVMSYIRPDKLMTADPKVVIKKVGSINPALCNTVREQLRKLFD